ncbi:hypothetical protein ABZT06_48710 [Streptomyces sp. NPDC005483]|uniref:hypothetical protein n=1 Tax=Streptomyces sp. NPDC005483 TaxID=3154882 RepID=UPI0033A0C5A5
MNHPARPLISSAATGVSSLALALSRAPWWLTAVALALGLLVTVIQSVFPQDSAHRLAWWRARWHQQQRRRSPLPARRRALRDVRRASVSRSEAPDRHGE